MLKSETATASKGGISKVGGVISGCSKVGVLSLLLWTPVVDQLLDEIEQYVHDGIVIVRGQSVVSLI